MVFKKVIPILVISLLSIQLVPSSLAAQNYGMVSGFILDKNGDPISGVIVEAQNNTYQILGSTTTGDDGKFTFDKLPIVSSYGYDNYRIKAHFNKNNKSYITLPSQWFVVYPLQCTVQNMTFYDYPSSGYGLLYGTVSQFRDWISAVPATIYLSNNMYTFYSGSANENWQLTLPEGDYTIWAERNKDNKTFISEKYTISVPSDDSKYLLIYLPDTNEIAYHEQPTAGMNIIHGYVRQNNQAPLSGVSVDLCKVSDSGALYPVSSTTTDAYGKYEFKDFKINTISEKYKLLFSYSSNGQTYSKTSEEFIVYYHNTFGVPHDITKSIIFDSISSGSLSIGSDPSGAIIWLDGINTTKKTPYNFTDILSGTHTCSLILDGYHIENFTVDVPADNVLHVNKTLKSDTGSIYLNIWPSDSLVYINDVYVGKGPISLTQKPCGKYTYCIVRDNYRSENGTFEILPGESITKEIYLVATPGLSLDYLYYLIENMFRSIGKIFTA